jgi:hypothetical protein
MSLKWWLRRGIPKWPYQYFRLVHYYDVSRYMYIRIHMMWINMYIYIYVPGSRCGSPPPRWYGTPLPPNKSTICIISESGPPICMLFAAFQSNNLPLATYLQDLRAVYFIQNILVPTMYNLHATYVLAIYIYVYFFSTYLRPIGYLCNYSYVIPLFVLYYILLIACVYATHTHIYIYHS